MTLHRRPVSVILARLLPVIGVRGGIGAVAGPASAAAATAKTRAPTRSPAMLDGTPYTVRSVRGETPPRRSQRRGASAASTSDER